MLLQSIPGGNKAGINIAVWPKSYAYFSAIDMGNRLTCASLVRKTITSHRPGNDMLEASTSTSERLEDDNHQPQLLEREDWFR